MRHLSLLVSTLLAGSAIAVPWSLPKFSRAVEAGFSVAKPGNVHNVVVTKFNTLNGTNHDNTTRIVQPLAAAAARPLPFAFVNNLGGAQINAYIQGLDPSGRVVFVRGDGSLVYPSSGGSQIPVPIGTNIAIPITGGGGTFRMTLPGAITSGRIYFAQGNLQFFVVSTPIGEGVVQPSVANLNDPSAGVNWGFVEFTYTSTGIIYANISYVDFVGLLLSMSLQVGDGSGTQSTRALKPGAVPQICSALRTQAGIDGRPWDKMCVSGTGSTGTLRVLSPNTYNVINPSGFNGYWDNYVNQVWSKYASTPLTIITQTPAAANPTCRVSGNVLNCSGDNRGYPKPTASDIWGCNSGPFAIQGGDNPTHYAVVPRLCAAFVRSTLLLSGGNVQPGPPASQYYKSSPTNHYSRVIHTLEVDGKGYAFPYDDVNPSGSQDSSGLVSSGNPTLLTVYVGGSG